jgi:hypothetical protein
MPEEWQNGERQITRFIDCWIDNRAAVEQLLKVDVGSDVAKKPVQMLNAVLKFVGLRVVECDRHKKGGRRV